ANFNMLRVWGGGIVEDPCFYRRCDEAGIMVWQDFPFACSLYPDDDPGFCAEVQREAETIVRQLRNHPSLVLWCGNNENDWIYARRVATGWQLPTFYGRKIYHEILPEVCARLDPSRPYWPSSPYGGEDPNSDLVGDRHHWDVPINLKDPVERVNFRRWCAERGKFVSEFGVLAPPGEESLRRFLPPGEQHVGSPGWRFHNNLFEMDNLATSLRLTWGEPTSLSLGEYVLATQIIQAEALKMAFEHLRRRQFATSGALFWAYNDCWGAIGWSVVDYTLARKPSFYHVRRALAPLLVSLHPHGNQVELWLTNGTRQDHQCSLEWGVLDLRGSFPDLAHTETVSHANRAQHVATIHLSPAMQAEKGRYLPFGRLLVDGETVAHNRCFLTGFAFKDLRLPPAEIVHSLQQVEGGEEAKWLLQLQATAFAWAVRLQVPSSVWVEDNYFDLLPGERREITLRGRAAHMAELKVTSMNTFRQAKNGY
ncbi:MAG: hypothetical protein FJ026_12160, partial [Chloroflexi bacterium]|nr:hypothetical protein [Chloroflexota bacterium]